jgi:hypothetical protein
MKISGSASRAGWKKAKQRRSAASLRRRSVQFAISWTDSYCLIFSRSEAGEFQSMRSR